MLQYVDYDIVFREVPDEVTLALNIAGCPNGCPGCHSPYLQRSDIGLPLTTGILDELMKNFRGEVTCICFMGGDAAPDEVERLARYVRLHTADAVRTAWYSGRPVLPDGLDRTVFNYIKLGPYRAADGPLDSPTTNQRFYRVTAGGRLVDMTDRFRRHPAG